MKLSELMNIFKVIEDELKKSSEKIKVLEAQLVEDFSSKGKAVVSAAPTSTSSSSSGVMENSTSSVTQTESKLEKILPPKIAGIFKKYKKSHDILANVYLEIAKVIEEATKERKQEVDYVYTPEFTKAYLLLPIYYESILIEKEIAIRNAQDPNQLCIDEKSQRFVFENGDFLNGFIQPFKEELQEIITIFSRAFNRDEINKELRSNQQDILKESNINHGFYIDGYNCFFENQVEFYPYRDVNPKIVEKKVNDFAQEYIKASKFPESVLPNLIGLLTTLAYQSGLPYLSLRMASSLYSFSFNGEKGAGNSYIFGGNDAHFRVDFDKDFKLKITFFSAGNKQNITNPPMPIDFPFARKIVLTIDVKVDKNNIPSFVIDDLKFSSCISEAKSAQTGFKPVFLKEAFKDSKKLPDNHVDLLRSFTDCLSKFAGYNSLQRMCVDLEKAKTVKDAENNAKLMLHFHPYLFEDLERKEKISKEEAMLLNNLYVQFYENKVSKEKISEMICTFISKQIDKISDDDKLRYIYLLKMAIALGGSELKAVKSTCLDLVKSLKKNKEYLLKAVKSEMAVLEAYREEFNSLFNQLPSFSKDEHLMLMYSLEKEHLARVIKNPSLLNFKDHRYVDFIAGLNPDSKINFILEFVLKHGKNAKYMQYLSADCFPTENDQFSIGEKMKKGLLPNLQAKIGKLVMESNLEEFNAVKNHLPTLLDGYVDSWPCTLKSIRQRVDILTKGSHVLEKLGETFLLSIVKDLTPCVNNHKKFHSLLILQQIVARLQEFITSIPDETETAYLWDKPLEHVQKLIAGKLQEIENVKAKQDKTKPEKSEFAPEKSQNEGDLSEKLTRTDQKMKRVITSLDQGSNSSKEGTSEEKVSVSQPIAIPVVFESSSSKKVEKQEAIEKEKEADSTASVSEKPKHF